MRIPYKNWIQKTDSFSPKYTLDGNLENHQEELHVPISQHYHDVLIPLDYVVLFK